MRSKLACAFMETNYCLLIYNPVSSLVFNILNLTQGVLAFAVTLELVTSSDANGHFLEKFYHLNEGTALGVTLVILLAFQVLTIVIYFSKILSKKIFYESSQAGSPQQRLPIIFITQLLAFMIVLNQTILNLFTKSLSLMAIISQGLEGASPFVLAVAVVTLLLNLAISFTFLTYLETVYPLTEVPWALPNIKQNLVNEIKVLLFAVCLAIPSTATALPWVLGACCILTLLMNLLPSTYYDKLTSKVFALNQSAFVASELVLTLLFSLQNYQQPIYIITFVFLLTVLFLFHSQALDRLSDTLRTKHRHFKTVIEVQKWFWMVNKEFHLKKDSSLEKQKSTLIKLQTVLKSHKRECFDYQCPCYNQKINQTLGLRNLSEGTLSFCKKVRMQLIDITMYSVTKHFQKNGVSQQVRHERLWNLFTFYYHDSSGNVLKCLFNLLKFHNCANCSTSDCFQNYTLKQKIIGSTKKKEESQTNLPSFEVLVSFESNLRNYIKVLEKTNMLVYDYWLSIKRGELDVFKAETQGGLLLKGYMEFKKVFGKMKHQCGEVFIVENLAMIFNRDVLQFEAESQQNWESLRILMNQMRVLKSKSKIDPSYVTTAAQKASLILVSCNPADYMKIVVASKPFVKMVGVQEDLLLNSKLHILLPNVVNEQHDSFVDKYLKSKRTKIDQAVTKRQWIRKADSSVKPVEISILPRVTLKDGIQLMAFVTEVPKIDIFDQQVDSALVFCFLADINDKLVHVSENCVKLLKISPAVVDSDIVIHQLIVDLPNIMENELTFDSRLDLKPCYQDNQEPTEVMENLADCNAKVCYKEYQFSNYLVFREYMFVVQKNFVTDQSFQLVNESLFTPHQNLISSQQISGTPRAHTDHNESDQSDIEGFVLQSQSTSSSSGSTNGVKYALVSDIKGALQFEKLPVSLKWYRLKFILGYFLILVTIVSLLAVNITSKNQFLSYLSSLQIQKYIRNRFFTTQLSLISLFGIANLSPDFDLTEIGVIVENNDYGQFYKFHLQESANFLHLDVTQFSLSKSFWDEDFVNTITEGQLELTYISTQGTIGVQRQTFLNNMNQVIGRADYIAQLQSEDMKVPWDIFSVTTIQQYANEIEKLSYNLDYIVSSFYTTLYNGSRNTLKQIFKIDERSTQSLLDQGDSVIDMLLGLTVGYALLVFLVTSCLIPYQFAVEQTQQKAVELANTTNSQHVQDILKNCDNFSQILKKNQCLEEVKVAQISHNKLAAKSQPKERTNKSQANITTTTANEYESKNDILSTTMKLDNSRGKAIQMPDQEKERPLQIQHKDKGKTVQQEELKESAQTKPPTSRNPNKQDQADYDEEQEQRDQTPKENPLEEESRQWQEKTSAITTYQIRKKNLVKVLLMNAIASLIVIVMFVLYALSEHELELFQVGLEEYEVFYNKIACVSENIFFMQKTILFNESMTEGTDNGDFFQKIDYICSNNEAQYRKVKANQLGMFQIILDELEQLDSSNFCEFLPKIGIDNQDCQTEFDGILNLGSEQFMSSLLAHIQQKKIIYESYKDSDRTPEVLRATFFDKKTWAFDTLFFKYMLEMFRIIQEQAQEGLRLQMEINFTQIIAIFGVFICVFAVLLLVCQARMVRKMQFKLVRSRMILKLIPSDLLIQIKERLGEINLKQL